MADTFSNDLRLRLQESGSNAGTWGTLLNGTITNIASALGQGSEAIPNASSHTITLADGTADEARSLYLKCTGGGQACTVTLGPNTISKVWIIDNATSYTLTFSQGSGANVAIAAGAVKVIATDGAGSGAAVVDTLDGLEGSLSTLAVTGTATMDGLTVDGNDSYTSNIKFDYGASAPTYFANWGYKSSSDGNKVFLTITDGGAAKDVLVANYNGSVGIGTSSPSQELELKAASVPTFKLNQADTYGAEIALRGNDLDIAGSANDIVFYTGGNNDVSTTERLRIDGATGSVGIGTSSPDSFNTTGGKFVVAGGTVQALFSDAANYTLGIKHQGSGAVGMFGGTAGSALALMTDNTERMRIDSAGNVGIGLASPSYLIHADAATATDPSYFVASSGSNFVVAMGSQNSPGVAQEAFIGTISNHALKIKTNNTEGMRIESGNLLVGRTSSLGSGLLTVHSNNAHGLAIGYGAGTNEYRRLYHHSSGLYFESSTNQAYLNSAGVWTDASDITYKKEIEDIDYGIETVKKLKPRKYKMKSDDTEQIGFVAQELVEQVPEIVSEKDGILGVAYGQLTAVLTKAIQEQQATIEALTQRIQTLENN